MNDRLKNAFRKIITPDLVQLAYSAFYPAEVLASTSNKVDIKVTKQPHLPEIPDLEGIEVFFSMPGVTNVKVDAGSSCTLFFLGANPSLPRVMLHDGVTELEFDWGGVPVSFKNGKMKLNNGVNKVLTTAQTGFIIDPQSGAQVPVIWQAPQGSDVLEVS